MRICIVLVYIHCVVLSYIHRLPRSSRQSSIGHRITSAVPHSHSDHTVHGSTRIQMATCLATPSAPTCDDFSSSLGTCVDRDRRHCRLYTSVRVNIILRIIIIITWSRGVARVPRGARAVPAGQGQGGRPRGRPRRSRAGTTCEL